MNNQWKWSRILSKSHLVSHLDCLKPWFLNSKNKFSNWETSLFAKWKTRSANYGFRQSKRLSEWLFLRILLYFHCLFLLFLITISKFQKSKFSNWKTLLFAKWKTRSANHGFRQPKTLVRLLFLRIPVHFHWIHALFEWNSWTPEK